MTYRELLERYRDGQLDPQQAAQIEAELEKHEAMGDFLIEEDQTTTELPEAPAAAASHESRFTEEIRRTVRRTFWRLGITVGTVVLALCLFVIFALPHVVDHFYYDPTEPSELWNDPEYQRPRLDLDLSVWTELFYPCGYRDDTSAESLGYGKYLVTFHSDSTLAQRPNAVSGLMDKNNLTLFDPNAFQRSGFLFFSPQDLGDTQEKRDAARAESFRVADQLWNDEDEYTAYVTLAEPMAYEDFYRWAADRRLVYQDLWCRVYTDLTPQYFGGLGFSLANHIQQADHWDQEKYLHLVLNNGWDFEADIAQQHFLSLLRYTLDNPDFTMSMEEHPTPELLADTAAWVEEHGLLIQGFAIRATKADFMELDDESIVANLSPFALY